MLRPVSRGVRARLPADSRSVQPLQPVYIDGSRSEDLDGRPGGLHYSWSCQLADSDAGCFVNNVGQLQRLEQRLGKFRVNAATLKVPAGLLAPEQ